MLNIIFRVDSGSMIGSGHVYRCLSFAEYIRNSNIEFICKNYDKNCIPLISKRYKVYEIEKDKNYEITLNINSWLGDTSLKDAKKTIDIIKNKNIDWLIIDHYSINKEWEDNIRPYVKNIFVIDDFTNREHNCEILLNQQIEPKESKLYFSLLPSHCKLLLGKDYILINKKFITASKNRKPITQLKRINIFMGGGDPSNETLKIIKICDKLNKKLNYPFIFDIIIGFSNKFKKEIEEHCNSNNNFNFHYNINYMENLFSKTDLAIGAGGGTTYERCIMGIPTILLCIAENQKLVLDKFINNKTVYYIGTINEDYSKKLKQSLLYFYNNPKDLIKMSKNCKRFLPTDNFVSFNKINNILHN